MNQSTFQQHLWAAFTAQRPEPDDGSPCDNWPVAVKVVDVFDKTYFEVVDRVSPNSDGAMPCT